MVFPSKNPGPNSSSTQNSLVFVSRSHGVWNSTDSRRKPSKRYGHLVQSPSLGLSEMLMHHKNDVFEFISERADVHDSEETEEEQSSRSPTKDKPAEAPAG